MADCGDQDASQGEPVVSGGGRRLVSEPRAKEGSVEPVAATVAGEHPPRPVGAVRGRRQADDEPGRLWVAEVWHRTAPIGFVCERLALFMRDLCSPFAEPGALLARDDASINAFQAAHGDPLNRMPIYEYELKEGECQMCPGRFEVLQGISEEPIGHCPGCGLPCIRVVSRASFKVRKGMSAEKAAERGFTTWRRAKKGEWEKVAGPGVDAIVGSEEDMKSLED